MFITDTLNLFLSSALGNDSALNDGQANEHTLKPVASPKWMEWHTCVLFTPYSTEGWVMGQELDHASPGAGTEVCLGNSCQDTSTHAPSWPLWAVRSRGVALGYVLPLHLRWNLWGDRNAGSIISKKSLPLLLWGKQSSCQEEYPHSIWLFCVNIAL